MSDGRTVLIVAYHHDASNMGSFRIRRIARRLGRFGWTVHLVTFGAREERERIGGESGYWVHRVPAADLQGWYRRVGRGYAGTGGPESVPSARSRDIGWTTFVNRWLLVPDKQIPWRRPAVRKALDVAANEGVRLIFTSLDPRTNFLVASSVARKTGIPAVMEYRDLWTGNPYPQLTSPTALHRGLHRALERRSLRKAARVSCVTRGMAEFVTKLHAGAGWSPACVNYNFFDPEEYPAEGCRPAGDGVFRLCYMGAFYTTRDPAPFFDGLGSFLRERRIVPDRFRFRWAGDIVGLGSLQSAIDRNGLAPYIDFLGKIPHAGALRELQSSSAALVVIAPDDALHIPGKLYEAMGAGVPTLLVANPSEAAEIVDRTRCGVHAPPVPAAVESALGVLWHRHETCEPWTFDPDAVREFDADHAVGRLSALFDQVLRGRGIETGAGPAA